VKVLAFRHVPFEGTGHIASVLEARGIGCDYADLYRDGVPDPDITAYAGLIFLGGPMSANDPLPYFDRERVLIARAVELGQPLLGICLGSQLIARSLGADVHRKHLEGNRLVRHRIHRGGRARFVVRRDSRSGDGVPLAQRYMGIAARRRTVGAVASMPESSVSRRPEHLRPAVPPGSNARHDRRMAGAGRELRRRL
jgi:Glutamine amidotransferase class-I